ncbi:hypothetical protein HYC85_026990 [Camellia sinensis]|uniref:ABC-2 type transporter transmembrane domain-containing protein n=1 Tax=Camellia sinensis TaxID=4442 RepID=A0A7J7G7F4_CAMSI|nr:hypothetical protein HYC85_026990 [Camellia sinensis]
MLKGTTLVSLLQPAPETYDLFDDIILLSDGQIVYQGPREHVLGFLEHMGFKCPERKGVADFLQEVTSKKDQKQYWACKDETYSFVTVSEFAEAFQSFHVGQRLEGELALPFDKTKIHPATLTTRKYGVSKKELLKACTSRELLLMKRNSFVYFFKLMQIIVMALITMTLFLRTDMHRNSIPDGGIYIELRGGFLIGPVTVEEAGQKEMFIEEVTELVELTPLRKAIVGLPGVNGLATEQHKRLTIAVELVANPSIIFMDEPTSGLDTRAAAIVMRTVRNTVDTGRTVVCTIHQPSIDIFEAFDEGIEEVGKIKDGYNPATWMLEITRNKARITELSTPCPGSKC